MFCRASSSAARSVLPNLRARFSRALNVLNIITLFGKLGWALYHDDAAVDDERVLYYGLPSSDSYPPCNIQFRCLAGSGAPIIECIIGPTPAKRTAILVDDMNKKKKKKKKKGGKKKKKKIKIKQEDEQIDNKQFTTL